GGPRAAQVLISEITGGACDDKEGRRNHPSPLESRGRLGWGVQQRQVRLPDLRPRIVAPQVRLGFSQVRGGREPRVQFRGWSIRRQRMLLRRPVRRRSCDSRLASAQLPAMEGEFLVARLPVDIALLPEEETGDTGARCERL